MYNVSNCRYVQVLGEDVFKEVGGCIHFVDKRVAERLGTEDSAIESEQETTYPCPTGVLRLG